MTGHRTHGGAEGSTAARAAYRRRQEARRREIEARLQRITAEREFDAIREAACERFGRVVPSDPFVIDLLASVELEEGDVWRWRGMKNNKGLPTCRMPRCPEYPDGAERSVVRLLAVAFGVIQQGDSGLLYPLGDADDVNPWHRRLRRTTKPLGNPNRYPSRTDAA